MKFDYGITVSEILKKYLERIEKPELFHSDRIFFICNATKLNWNDKTKIEEKFSNGRVHLIMVNDNYNLVG